MALVLDTGPLLAAHLTSEPRHQQCRSLFQAIEEPLLIPAPVFVELEYLLHKRASLRTWLQFADDVANGAYSIYPLDAAAVTAAARLQERYRDLRLGFVDAAVFTCCVALKERKVATLDHRHFSVLRTDDGFGLELLPSR
ncbi:MAG: type II toxin-antitoxin system VapC family toxin [Actinomycetota bacterium]